MELANLFEVSDAGSPNFSLVSADEMKKHKNPTSYELLKIFLLKLLSESKDKAKRISICHNHEQQKTKPN